MHGSNSTGIGEINVNGASSRQTMLSMVQWGRYKIQPISAIFDVIDFGNGRRMIDRVCRVGVCRTPSHRVVRVGDIEFVSSNVDM